MLLGLLHEQYFHQCTMVAQWKMFTQETAAPSATREGGGGRREEGGGRSEEGGVREEGEGRREEGGAKREE